MGDIRPLWSAENLDESMDFVRRAIPLVLALVCVAPANAATTKPAAPTSLHAFLMRADEAATHNFQRTPSFAWTPVKGTLKYEFELSSSSRFSESARLWSGKITGTPAVAPPLSLPWTSDSPYAFYARVRTIAMSGTSAWSKSFGFNMSPPNAPVAIPSHPGLVRWSTVEGATSYQVWWTDLGKQVSSLTNALDEREYYTLHQADPWPSSVRWRVRAVRTVYGTPSEGLPAESYGPWSPILTSYNPPFPTGSISLTSTISATVESTFDASKPHTHMPAFLFSGSQSLTLLESELYRVYVFTERDCVNQVFRGAVVGSPAYSPRTTGPLALPVDGESLLNARQSYLRDGSEGTTQMADLAPVTTSEELPSSTPSTLPPSQPSTPPPSSEPAASPAFTLPTPEGGLVDLWDSGWPSGKYYWTVIPVNIVSSESGDGSLIYRDAELPQDACKAGRVRSFGKESEPALIADKATTKYKTNTPFASGLSPTGRLLSAAKTRPVFYGTPLVAWRPASGAVAYEVQWSRKLSPWKTQGEPVFTFGTSTLLQQEGAKPLAPGTWYYRVRGLDPYVPGSAKQMSWATPVRVDIAKPKYVVVPTKPTAAPKSDAKKQIFRTWNESGFSASVPIAWRGVDHRSIAAEVARNPVWASAVNPNLIAELKRGGSAPTRFLAYDPDEYTTMMFVRFLPIPSYNRPAWAAAIKKAISSAKEFVGPLRCSDVRLPAGTALRCTYSRDLGAIVEAETAFFFDRGAATYQLHYGSRAKDAASLAGVIAASARAFRITS